MLDTDPRRSDLANASGGGVERLVERVSGGSAGGNAELTHRNPAAAPASDEQAAPWSEIRVGPAGWSYPDWAGYVYPSPRPKGFHEATYLAEFFDTIEINTSFYSPLQPGHAHQWLERVAANPRFLFTAKLWQKFTHETFFEEESGTTAAPARSSSSKLSRMASGSTGNPSAEDERVVRAGFDVLRNAGKLGAVLLQFPFSFHNTAENLARLNHILDDFGMYPLVVEVRHASWAKKEFYELLHRRGVGFCNIDQPVIGRSIRPSERVTSPIGYVRLHGRRYDTWFSDDPASPPSERYNYLYSEEELEPWAKRIEHVAENARTTFVVTNNHFEAKGIVNALQLIHLLSGNKVKVPETLRTHYPQLEAIANEPAAEPTLFPMPPK
jgi:uncharacterized protein YecE (DUF72 family)